jgi:hypothetical protein
MKGPIVGSLYLLIDSAASFLRKACLFALLLCLAIAVSAMPANAAAISTTATGGNWNAGGTWTGGLIPGTADTVTVANGATLTCNVSSSCASVAMTGGALATTIVISGTTLAVTGAVTINAPTAAVKNQIQVGTGTLTAGSLTITGGTTSTYTSEVNASNGTISIGTPTVAGNVAFGATAATSRLTFTGAGTLNVSGTFTGGTFTCSTGTVNYNKSAGAQSINTYTFYNLTLGNTSGINTTAGNLTVNGTLTTTAGGTLNMGTNTFTTLNAVTNNGIITTQNLTSTPLPAITWGGTVNYNAGTGAQTVRACAYTNLTLGNTSGTSSLEGNVTVSGVFTTTASGILNLKTYTIGTPGTITNGGTVRTQNTSTTPIPSGTWGGTVQYDAATGGQTIRTGTYATLTLSNTSNTSTADGTLTVNTALNTTAGGYLNMGTFDLAGTLSTITNNGTIRTQSISATPVTTGKTWGGSGTVQYDAATGGQTIMATLSTGYTNLTLSNTSGTDTASGTFYVSGALTTTAGGILNMVTYSLGGSPTSVTSNGTIRTQMTGGTPIPTAKVWAGTISYDASSGSQNISNGTYNNLTLGNTSGTSTAVGALVVNGTLLTTAGGTLSMGANTFTTLNAVTNNGTIATQNLTSTPLPANIASWGGTVSYNAGSGAQTVRNTGTYTNLTLGNTSGTSTLEGNVTVSGTFTTTASGILNLVTYTIGSPATVTNGGTVRTQNTTSTPIPSGTWGGTVNYDAATGGQTVRTGTYATLTLGNTSGTSTAEGDLSTTTFNTTAGGTLNMVTYTLGVSGTPTNNGTIRTQSLSSTPLTTGKTWAGTVIYDADTGGQTIMASSATGYTNLTLGNTSGTDNASGNVTVSGTLTVPANTTLNMAAYQLLGAALTPAISGTIRTQFASGATVAIPTGKTWGGTVQYDLASGAQYIPAGTFNNLAFSNTGGTDTASGNLTVNGTLTTTAGGTLSMGTNTFTALNAVTNNGTIATQNLTSTPLPANIASWGGTVSYNAGSGAQTVRNTGTYTNLTLGNTSGTSTLEGNVTVSGTFTTTASGILNLVTYTIGSPATVTNGGTVRTQNTTSTPIPTSGGTWGGTVQYDSGTAQPVVATTYNNLTFAGAGTKTTNSGTVSVGGAFSVSGGTADLITNSTTFNYSNAAGGQSILSQTYYDLTLSNTSGVDTAAGNLTINHTLTTTAGGILNMGTNTLSTANITNNGYIRTQNTSATPIPTGLTWGGTVTYDATAGGQTIMTGTYNNLSLANTTNTSTAEGNITVNGIFTTTASGYFNMGTNQLLGTLTPANSGTLRTQSTSSEPIPTGKTWAGTVRYDALTGGQTVRAGSYAALTLSNTSDTDTADGNVTSSGTLTTTAGGTLNMATYTLGVSTITNNGTIRTQNTSGTPLTTGKSWGGTVQYDADTGAQTIMTGTYSTLILNNSSGTDTASGALSVTNLTTPANGTLNMATYTLTVTTPTNNGTIRTQCLTNPAITASKTWGGTVQYDAATGAQYIPAGTFNNLTFSNTSGIQNASGALTVNGTLTTTAGGIFSMAANALSGTLSTISNNGTFRTLNLTATPIPSGLTWSGTGTFEYAGGAQTIVNGIYNNLYFSAAGTKTLATGTITVNGNWNVTAATATLSTNNASISVNGDITGTGNITSGSGTISLGGAWSNSGTFTRGTGTVNYNAASGGQTVNPRTYYNLTLGNTGGTSTAGGNITVDATLATTTGGIFDMSTYTLTGTLSAISNDGSISTLNTTTSPLPAGKNWGNGSVIYSASGGGQRIKTGTYRNLYVNNTSGIDTAEANLTVSQTMTNSSGGTGILDLLGSNTIESLTIPAPRRIRFTPGTTTTVTTFSPYGSAGNIITLESLTPSSQFTLSKSGGGRATGNYLSIKDSNASPATTWYAPNSVDLGGNSGWTFLDYLSPLVYVSPTGNDGNSGDYSSPYLTIQKGLNSVAASGEVMLLPGVYTIESSAFVGGSMINWPNKDNITLKLSPEATEPATIDAQALGRIISLEAPVSISIEGITLQNAYINGGDPDGSGGGVFMQPGSRMYLVNTVIRYCTSDVYGGAVSANCATVEAVNCYFEGNRGGWAGGGVTKYGTWIVDNCTFNGNEGAGSVGSLTNFTASNSIFENNRNGVAEEGTWNLMNCIVRNNNNDSNWGGFAYWVTFTATNTVFERNSSAYGGGVCYDTNATMVNCTVYNNNGITEAGVMGNGSLLSHNSIFWGNTSPSGPAFAPHAYGTYYLYDSVIQPDFCTWPSDGWINAAGYYSFDDPKFISTDPANASYLRLGPYSSCMDKASSEAPATDMANNPRPYGFGNDIGAYEFQGPSLLLVQPNGGELLTEGVAYPITFNVSPDANDIYVRISTDNGATWTEISHETSAQSGACTFEWTPSASYASENCFISIEASNGTNWNIDASNSRFEIEITPLPIVYISPTGDDSANDGSVNSPYKTLQKGLKRVAAGGEVLAMPGVYAQDQSEYSRYYNYTMAEWSRKTDVSLRATFEADGTTGPVTVDAQNTGRVFGIDQNRPNISLTIEGISFINSKAISTPGGFMVIRSDNVTVRLKDIYVNGSAEYTGGAIDCVNDTDNIYVDNSTFEGCIAYYPGGVGFYGTWNAKNSSFIGNSAYQGGIGYSGTWTVDNCSFINNTATYIGGAGAAVGQSGTWNVSNSTFEGNTSVMNAGVGQNGTWNVVNSTFKDNICSLEGGVFQGITLSATNCVFENNHAVGNGGVYSGGSANYYECLFRGNRSDNYGSINTSTTMYANNCLFVNNSAKQNVFYSGGFYLNNCSLYGNTAESYVVANGCSFYATNCLIFSNSADDGTIFNFGGMGYYVNHSNIQPNGYRYDMYYANSNISIEPNLVDPANGDYHLGMGSPCIDRGMDLYSITTKDYDNNIRPNGLGWDMGAYEFQGPSVRVIYPNGGELITPETQTYPVTFNVSPDVTDVYIRASSNGGASWTEISHEGWSHSGVSTFEWTPSVEFASTECLVSVEVFDGTNWNLDNSDATFEVFTPVQLAVTLISPNGFNGAIMGGTFPISWDATPAPSITGINLSYSTGESYPWVSIIANTPNDGAYTWDVPNIRTSGAKISIEAIGDDGKSVVASSENTFIISSSDIYFSNDGSDSTGDGTVDFPYQTLQTALDWTPSGGYTKAFGGIYSGIGNRNVSWPNRSGITLKPSDETSVCTIDAEYSGWFISQEAAVQLTIEAFTLMRAVDPTFYGIYLPYGTLNLNSVRYINNGQWWGNMGAVYMLHGYVYANDCAFTNNDNQCFRGGNWVTNNCDFSNNRVAGYGGVCGVETDPMSWTMTNCTIKNNYAVWNGGVMWAGSGPVTVNADHSTIEANTAAGEEGGVCWGGTWNVSNCTFKDNFSGRNGGGVGYGGTWTATNCAFTGNKSNVGGVFSWSSVNLMNCSFSGNKSNGNNGDVMYGSVISATNSIFWDSVNNNPFEVGDGYGTLTNCIVQNGDWSGYTVTDCSSDDPQFVNGPAGYLMLTQGSAALNSGTSTGAPSTAIDGTSRPQGAGYDMGCYEQDAGIALLDTVYVATDGSDSAGNGSQGSPYQTIQQGLNMCSAEGIVYVKTGIYQEHDINWSTRNNITISGEGYGVTTIDAQQISRVIKTFAPLSLSIESISLINGQMLVADYVGGGIYLCSGSTLELTNVLMNNNRAPVDSPGQGGAIYSWGSSVRARNSLFTNSYAQTGGVALGGDWDVESCSFISNLSHDYGIAYYSNFNAKDCVFSNNGAYYGGISAAGIWNVENCSFIANSGWTYGASIAQNGTWTATNCVFADNGAGASQGIAVGGDWTTYNCTFFNNYSYYYGGGPSVGGIAASCTTWNSINSIYWGNGAVDGPIFDSMSPTLGYCDIQQNNFLEGTGNISVEPMFSSTIEGDVGAFRLGMGSLCIDKGSSDGSTLDADGNPRPHGFGFDMGPYEFQGPSVQVIQPNGTESIAPTDNYSIMWNISPEASEVRIWGSTNGGISWNTPITDEAWMHTSGIGTFEWTPGEAFVSTNCLLSIEAFDGVKWNYAVSNASFIVAFPFDLSVTPEAGRLFASSSTATAEAAIYHTFVKNMGMNADSYNLSAVNSDPSWNTTFHLEWDDRGVPAADAVSQITDLAAGASIEVFIVTTPSLDATLGSINTTEVTITSVASSAVTASATFETMVGNWMSFKQPGNTTGRSVYSGPSYGVAKWHFNTSTYTYFNSSPSIGIDGTIYAGATNNYLYAINPDGTEKWRFNTNGVVYYSAPAIDLNGTIYTGDSNNYLYAINPDGTEKWRFNAGIYAGIYSSPAIASDGTIYVGSTNNYFFAINPDGTEKWRLNIGSSIYSSPTIGNDGIIYFGSGDGNLNAINPDGTEKWRFNTGGGIYYTAASIASDGTVYMGSTNGYFFAINPDGSEKWRFNATGSIYSSPSIDLDGIVYIANTNSQLYALYPNDGSEKWRFNTGGANYYNALAIDNNRTVYSLSSDGNLYAINPDGSEKWRFNSGASFYSAPAIGSDGIVYAAAGNGKLYAVGNFGIIQPNGGETVNASPTYPITFGISAEVDDIYISLSTNEGVSWDTLITHETTARTYTGISTYEWTPTADLIATDAMISIDAHTTDGVWYNDTSDAKFRILGPSLAIVYVSPTGRDEYPDGDGSLGKPYYTIQRGLDCVTAGGEVRMLSGVYTQEAGQFVNYNMVIWPNKQNITLKRAPESTEPATIDAQAYGRVIQFAGTQNVTIDGITIKNAYVSGNGSVLDINGFNNTNLWLKNVTITTCTSEWSWAYGAICANWDSNIYVDNCYFADNRSSYGAVGYGGNWTITNSMFISNESRGDGGVLAYCQALTASNSIFKYNKSYEGTGGVATNGNMDLQDCEFSDNSAQYGGAIAYASPLVATNCTFARNSANYGGALYCIYSSTYIDRCSFIGNTSNNDGGAIGGAYGSYNIFNNTLFYNNASTNGNGGVFVWSNNMNFNYCTFADNHANNGAIYSDNSNQVVFNSSIFSGNSATYSDPLFYSYNPSSLSIVYSDIQPDGYIDGTGNISAEPNFVSILEGNSDFLQLNSDSPCIDTASTETYSPDRAGNPRPGGLGNDMGAYEYQELTTQEVPSVATRFYLPSTGAAEISPAFSAWDNTNGADHIRCITNRVHSAFANKETDPAGSAGTYLNRQYVSDPIAPQTISGYVSGEVRGAYSGTIASPASEITIKVVSNSGQTIRGTLLDLTSGTKTYGTSLKSFWTPVCAALTTVEAQSGDRIVIEIGGIRGPGYSTPTIIQEFGDSSLTDEAENVTDQKDPWIGFSEQILFPRVIIISK